ncbi:hypothetical protein EGM51_04620 [Verrucomicrobia bacterium S94]|nr:hypothetical protein EGM51_04620 [Verrucomicrobia bacterium S94]
MNMIRWILPVFAVISARAAIIDFDAVYGSASGWTLAQHLSAAVDSASPGDIIQFNSAYYDFQGQGPSVDKAVTLRGIVPDSFDGSSVGATNVTTVFDHLKHFNVYSSNFTLQHLELREDASTTYAFNRFKRTVPEDEDPHQFYTNIVV